MPGLVQKVRVTSGSGLQPGTHLGVLRGHGELRASSRDEAHMDASPCL